MLLTGRYMHNVGIYSNGGSPSLDYAVLPDRLKQASPGLRAVMIGKVRALESPRVVRSFCIAETQGWCSQWHLGQAYRRYTPTYRGFDDWTGYYDGDEDYLTHTFPTGKCAKPGSAQKANATGRCGGLCAIDVREWPAFVVLLSFCARHSLIPNAS